jgi:glycosyltransferase involved in cell wall biosynthesis
VNNLRRLRVAYVLSYYAPDYIRSLTLVEALRRLERVKLYTAVNRSFTFVRYFETVAKLVYLRIRYKPDCYILGFRGYELFWLVRLITWRKPLIFDHMMSPYDSLLNESKRLQKGSLAERLVYYYEWAVMHSADIVLTDTAIHRDYFIQLFKIVPERIHHVPVSTDETLFRFAETPSDPSDVDCLSVLFYGSFLPLHGIDVILRAAALLKDEPIRFLLIGGNRQDLSGFHRRIQELNLVNVCHQPWVDYRRLPELIVQADLCLGGPFGNTGQARRVITAKTFQCLAMGRATVVGKTDSDHGFRHKVNAFVVRQGDPQELADAIRWAAKNHHQRREIGRRGFQLYQNCFSIDCVKRQLEELLPL